MISCETLMGKTILIPKEKLVYRPSVYGVILYDGKILLARTKSKGKYALPGGKIEIGENIEDALRREVREETGIEVAVERFRHFEEQFFYYDPTGEAFHCFLFFYLCRPQTITLIPDDQVADGEVEKPRWVQVGGLKREDFHNWGDIALDIIQGK